MQYLENLIFSLLPKPEYPRVQTIDQNHRTLRKSKTPQSKANISFPLASGDASSPSFPPGSIPGKGGRILIASCLTLFHLTPSSLMPHTIQPHASHRPASHRPASHRPASHRFASHHPSIMRINV